MKNLVPKLGLFLLILIFTLGQLGGCSCATDTVSPVVQITNPVNNSDVSDIVIIQAKASDDVGVAKVEFYIDNSKVGEDSQSLYKYSWNTDSLAYGSTHTIYAKAYDNAGNEGVSPSITVTIGDSQLPTVVVTNPVDGGTVTGTVTIKANAVDRSIPKGKSKSPSGIQKVEFYVDDRLLGEALTSPYDKNWNTDSLAYGSTHTIYAKAYDNAGNEGVSPPITVTIGDSQLPTVTITNPVDGGTVIGIVTIKA
ncbi:TPA: hypothetical protein GXX44_05100, partial [bacterium]|nr:hypothetical protein [bacterium]